MKSSFLYYLLVFLILILLVLFMIQLDNNGKLKDQIELRDTLIEKSRINDSLSCEHTEEYVKTVTKYISNDCSIMIDKKKISLDEFINIYIKQADQNDILKDSLAIVKSQLQLIKERYSLSISLHKENANLIASFDAKKIDSALMLLSVFRDRLRFDSVSNKWMVRK